MYHASTCYSQQRRSLCEHELSVLGGGSLLVVWLHKWCYWKWNCWIILHLNLGADFSVKYPINIGIKILAAFLKKKICLNYLDSTLLILDFRESFKIISYTIWRVLHSHQYCMIVLDPPFSEQLFVHLQSFILIRHWWYFLFLTF